MSMIFPCQVGVAAFGKIVPSKAKALTPSSISQVFSGSKAILLICAGSFYCRRLFDIIVVITIVLIIIILTYSYQYVNPNTDRGGHEGP